MWVPFSVLLVVVDHVNDYSSFGFFFLKEEIEEKIFVRLCSQHVDGCQFPGYLSSRLSVLKNAVQL